MSELVVRPRAGDGVLFRDKGLIVLMGPAEPEVITQVLAIATASVATVEPGRHFCRSVAWLLADGGHLPATSMVGNADGGTVFFVHGAATVTADGLVLDGRSAVTTTELTVASCPSVVNASVGESTAEDSWCVLGSGIIRASGYRMVADESIVPEHTFAESITAESTTAEPITEEPITEEPIVDVPDVGSGMVNGLRCRNGHFSDPGLIYCDICGIGLTQAGCVPTLSERSVLGVLVLDDGRSLPLDRDHLLGRSPGEMPDGARVVAFDDPLMSDMHALVRLHGWDVSVTDVGSAHGTFVRDPDARSWRRVSEHKGEVLRPGALIALGGRQLRYESHRAK